MRATHLAAAAVLVAALAAGCSSNSSGNQPIAIIGGGTTSASALVGDMLRPPTPEPAIELEDTAGSSYDLRKETAGKIVLVYFGYTHCPDICPTIMADVAEALRQSSAAVRGHVKVAFVSVDPVRDSTTVIRKWLNHFNPSFIGLRGTIQQIISVQHALGIPASQVRAHSLHGYTVVHSAELLEFTPDHLAHLVYTEGPTTIQDIKHDLATLVNERKWGA
ncbi:MAG TPA: SCO family protein [Mycobacteriales bacterium]|jgi:protein SCO1/2|nr:SCO family protein [Mycobacteriales bacterium]